MYIYIHTSTRHIFSEIFRILAPSPSSTSTSPFITQEGLAATRSPRCLCDLLGCVGRATGSGGFDLGEEEMPRGSPRNMPTLHIEMMISPIKMVI